MQRLAAAIPEKHQTTRDGGGEPEQHVDQIDPDSILGPLDAAIALRVLVDEKLAKDAEDSDPENTAFRAAHQQKRTLYLTRSYFEGKARENTHNKIRSHPNAR